MIHIENIPHIMKYGITHSRSVHRNTNFQSIGDPNLIEHRNQFILPNGKSLGEYTPFYFGYRMPMLYVIQKGFNNVSITDAEKIVYLVSSVQKMIDLEVDFLFSNGHATNGLSHIYEKKDINKIEDLIDFQAINKKYWRDENDLDLKRRKEAEFLVAGDIPCHAILGYVVYNQSSQQIIETLSVNSKIVVRPDYYF